MSGDLTKYFWNKSLAQDEGLEVTPVPDGEYEQYVEPGLEAAAKRFIEKMKDSTQIVKDIVSRHPRAATDYQVLYFYFLREYCGLPHLTPEQFQKIMIGLRKINTISRTRRKLAEKNEIEVPQVKRERDLAFAKHVARQIVKW
ncbi:MAG: hypothetical protein QXE05_00255 [Nitrososphaeria archaeon]